MKARSVAALFDVHGNPFGLLASVVLVGSVIGLIPAVVLAVFLFASH